MHALELLHNTIATACPNIHSKRLEVLIATTQASLIAQRLSLTQLGCSIASKAYVKHSIKRVDRLLGNEHLYRERTSIYACIAKQILKQVHQPINIVDWSELADDQAYHLLRASIPVGGRALTEYEEVHPIKKLFNRKLHKKFLCSLKALLPKGCCPIIVTDAGFCTTWFEQLDHMGWDYVGRVRNRTLVRKMGDEQWQPCKTLYSKATNQARYIGQFQLNRSNPMSGNLYLIKQKPMGRCKRNADGTLANCGRSNKIAKGQREPWLLVTTLGGEKQLAKKIVSIYKTRMQIEESFRDLKSSRLGLSIKESLTRDKRRLEILLLIGLLATYCLWLIGTIAESKKYHLQYQSNTTKTRRVLLVFYLGCLLVKKDMRVLAGISKRALKTALALLKKEFDYACFT